VLVRSRAILTGVPYRIGSPLNSEPSASSVRIVGRYAVYDAIAAGGMATVHYGRLLGPVGFSRTVAIKRLHAQFARDPEFVSMFLDEARLAARIRHPNVVPTLDVVATGGELFLVMDYVPGESLARLIRTATSLGQLVPPRITVAIVAGVLRGLHAAHEATNERGEALGIVHRDVSPQNILVGTDGQARVLDFGVAKAVGRLQTTRDGKLKGKLAYMAPEQLRGKTVDRRTDVFAASAVLWEALTGRRLFKGDNEGAIVTKILEGDVVPPSSVILPGETDANTMLMVRTVDQITLKGLSTDPTRRFGSAREMAAALEQAVPPAGMSEVSEWVETFAKDVLVSRARQVADIESNSAVGPATHRDVEQSDETSLNAPPPPTKPEPRGSVGDDSVSSARPSIGGRSDMSSISVASQARAQGVPTRRSGIIIGASVASVVALLLAIGLRGKSAESPRAASPQPSSSAASEPAPIPSASSTPKPVATGIPEPSPSAEPADSITKPPPTIPKAPAVSHPAAHPAPPPATHPAAPSGCNPPYAYDSQGLKHFKPECL
jgi:eukaryotic-like serine/threonine-protein kinase